MGLLDRTLVIVGPEGAGKATLTGCMLIKYGGIDTVTMQQFQNEGIQKIDEAVKNLKRRGITPGFETPKKHQVKILDADAGPADCTILVLPAGSPLTEEVFQPLLRCAKELIIVINKMDKISWSEDDFQKIIEGLELDTENIPIIPISALHGDNVVEKSPKGSWYRGWKRGGQSGVTLLEALDMSFQN